jgi:hypothetical protein
MVELSPGRIVMVQPMHVARVTSLLRGSYMKSTDFEVTDEAHLLISFDGSMIVLAVLDGETIVSTMQIKLAARPSDLDHANEISLLSSDFPGLYLRRAATLADKRFSSLNSLLRLYCIEASITIGIKSLFGLVFEGGPRVRTLQTIGYRLTPVSADREAFLRYRTQCLFAHFNIVADGQAAASFLRQRSATVADSFTWDNRILIEALSAWVK